MNFTLILLISILAGWTALLILIKRKYRGDRVAIYGPILLLKTKRGIEIIQRIARAKLWNQYSLLCVFIAYLIMIFSFFLIVWQLYLVITLPRVSAPSPVHAIGLPGINPIIPITYGIVGIIIAIVVHEGAHGIIASHQQLKIMSMGLAFLVIPLGAFVEPNEEELKTSSKIKRIKIFSAGPCSNILVGIIFLLVFIAGASAIAPKQDGVVVLREYLDTPLEVGDLIFKIENSTIKSSSDIINLSIEPGKYTNIMTIRNEKTVTIRLLYGIYVIETLKNSPAAKIGIKKGDVIYSIDGNIIYNYSVFRAVMDSKRAGETINITLISNSTHKTYQVTLIDKYEYYYKNYNIKNEEYRGRGFLGISVSVYGLSLSGASEILDYIRTYSPDLESFVKFISLPFAGLEPMPEHLKKVYEVPFEAWWEILHYSYWIAWLNLLVGLTNLIPAIPLDGGHILRDSISKILGKMKNAEKISNIVTIAVSILVLVIIIWIFTLPRL